MGCFCESGFSKSIPTGAAGTSARSRAQSTTADPPGLYPGLPRSQGATPASHKRKLSLAGKGTGPRSGAARTRTGRGSNPGSGSSRRRGTGSSRQGRPSSPPGPARGPHPAPRPGGGTAAALPGAAAAEVAPLGLASVLRPRRLRSGQGWSGRRSRPPAPCASHPLPRLRPQLAAPGSRSLLPFLPSPRPLLSLSVVSFPRGARTHSRPLLLGSPASPTLSHAVFCFLLDLLSFSLCL